MLPASLYSLVFSFITLLLTIILSIRYSSLSDERLLDPYNYTSRYAWIIPVGIALFIGFRPVDGYYFVDMANYEENYRVFLYGSQFKFSLDEENYLFDNIFNWLGANRVDITLFFVGSAIIYFVGTYAGLRLLFPSNALYAFVCFVGAFSTFSYGTNGLKAGMGAALFILALGFYKRPLIMAIGMLISLGFHHSMILPIVAVTIAYFCRNSRLYLLFWFFALIIAALGITSFQTFLGSAFEEGNNTYLTSVNDDWGGKTGFRYDFILYSCLPIVTGYLWVVRRNIKDFGFSLVYNTYVISNAVWMLCMYANFTNRIAYLSWFLYPIVLVYPLFKIDLFERQSQIINYVVWGQLIITLILRYLYGT